MDESTIKSPLKCWYSISLRGLIIVAVLLLLPGMTPSQAVAMLPEHIVFRREIVEDQLRIDSDMTLDSNGFPLIIAYGATAEDYSKTELRSMDRFPVVH